MLVWLMLLLPQVQEGLATPVVLDRQFFPEKKINVNNDHVRNMIQLYLKAPTY